MKRVQFSLLAKRPASPGWPAANRIRPSTPSVRRGDDEREPRVGDVRTATAEREADDHEQRQRDHPAEPFEHDRRERGRGRVDGLRAARDAHDVAADRRRQHVAHELAGEVVAGEGAERDRGVEEEQHLLPAPGRQHDPEEHRQRPRRRAGGRCGAGVSTGGCSLQVGHPGEEHGEEHRAQTRSRSATFQPAPDRRATAGSPDIAASLRAGAGRESASRLARAADFA